MTLAEAIVVLTLIGLLAGFSIPRLLEPTPTSIVTDEAELLAWTLRLARYRAITLNQTDLPRARTQRRSRQLHRPHFGH